MSHHKLTVYDDIPAKALDERAVDMESQGIGAGLVKAGHTHTSLLFHSLPEHHLLDSVVQENPGGLEEEAKVYSDLFGMQSHSQKQTMRQKAPSGQTYKEADSHSKECLPGAGAAVWKPLDRDSLPALFLLAQEAWLLTLWLLPWVEYFSRALEVPTS